jgi:1,4-dihydroxy-2-naphthoyl-CoA hydrolase
MPSAYLRTIRFADTDAAGVVFFSNHLAICHEAYEESLAAAGVEVNTFFREQAVVVPIAKSQAEYLRPLACGDKIRVTLTPVLLGPDRFAIDYEMHRLGRPNELVARARTEHICISPQTRERQPLPPAIAAWIQRSSA